MVDVAPHELDLVLPVMDFGAGKLELEVGEHSRVVGSVYSVANVVAARLGDVSQDVCSEDPPHGRETLRQTEMKPSKP